MDYNSEDALRWALAAIRAHTETFVPEWVFILGSGLGYIGDVCEKESVAPIIIPYNELPGFPQSTAPGHRGRLILGQLEGKNVAILQGRCHSYEGYGFDQVAFGLRVLRLMGAEKLLVTNASGGVREDLEPGTILRITDHIKLFGDSPLRGANLDCLGTRFPDMSVAYDKPLGVIAERAAAHLGIDLASGVYFYFPGPQYETPAEILAARALGGDVVGMSTVAEVIAARHAGMRVLGFSLVSNKAAGMGGLLSEEDVLFESEKARGIFSRLILEVLQEDDS